MTRLDPAGERGAVLVFTALAILTLVGFLVFVIDLGVLLVARGQAQNAADAGALAGATARAFDDPAGTTITLAAAHAAADANTVWDAAGASFVAADANACPSGYVDMCVRVEVHRTTDSGGPIPAVFGPALGIVSQDVRAVAVAHVSPGNAVDCLRPFALRDTGTMYRHGDPLTLPFSGLFGPTPATTVALLDLQPGPNLMHEVRSCASPTYGVSDTLTTLVPGPADQGLLIEALQHLVALDPGARFDRGAGVVSSPCADAGSCLQYLVGSTTPVPDPDRTISPRIVPLVLSNPSANPNRVDVVNILGFFVETYTPTGDITGTVVRMPGKLLSTHPAVDENEGFLQVIRLVR